MNILKPLFWYFLIIVFMFLTMNIFYFFGINILVIILKIVKYNKILELYKIILFVYYFKVFLFEPFKIPSSSMNPNLLVGDYIFVSKYSYGYSKYSYGFGSLMNILLDKTIFFDKKPQRGDVIVFKEPRENRENFIKRIIGLPGDRIKMINNIIYINDDAITQETDGFFLDGDYKFSKMKENNNYNIIHISDPALLNYVNFDDKTVPYNMYFVLGDNRHNSNDSRYWGYVPRENIIGKAQYIWFSWSWGNSKLRYKRFFTKII
jgi:signal peptidase I